MAAKASAQLLRPLSFLVGRKSVKGCSTSEVLKHLLISCRISSLVSGGTSEAGVSSCLGAWSFNSSCRRSWDKLSLLKTDQSARRPKTPPANQ